MNQSDYMRRNNLPRFLHVQRQRLEPTLGSHNESSLLSQSLLRYTQM